MYCLVEFCCICFINEQHLKHLCASGIDNITYFIKLTSCVPEMCFSEMNDQWVICKTCCETMDVVYKFRQECLSSKTALMDYISQLRQVSNISGDENVYLTDVNKLKDMKKEYLIKNNLEIKSDKYKLCKNMERKSNENETSAINFEEEISEHPVNNPISLKSTVNRPNYIQVGNVVVKVEYENSDEEIEESLLENQHEIEIDVSNNAFNLTAPEIKKENDDQDEHLQESSNCILGNYNVEFIDVGRNIGKNFDDRMAETFDSSLENQNIKIDVISNIDINLKAPEIKKENDDQDEHLQESSDNIFETCDVGNVGIKIEKNEESTLDSETCSDDAMLNLDDIKIDIVDNELTNDEINIQCKSEDVDESSKDGDIIPSTVNDEDETDEDAYSSFKTKLMAQNKSELQIGDVSNRNVGTIERNMRIHTDKKAPKHKICKKTQSSDVNRVKLLECKVCKKTFTRSSNLTEHMITHTGEKPYECTVCKKKFNRANNLTIHMRIHTGEKLHECNVCTKTFARSSNLTDHLRTHTGEKPHECKVCKKTFARLGYLTKHLITHTGEKKFECSVCKKKFMQANKLTIHMRIHTGEKPYECNVCKKTFIRPSNLTEHLRTHTGVKPHECKLCKKAFTRSSNLTEHLLTHTGEKRFECTVCKKKFSQGNNLTIHMRIHTGEKPYECNVCKKTFTRSNNLTEHLRTHTGEKRHECTVCKKKFSHARKLTAHAKSHWNKTI